MCLIIHKPKDRKVPKDVLQSALDFNQDGYGLMYSDHGSLIIEKSLDPEWLIKRLPKLRSKELIIHLRMRTHGPIDLDSAHPFQVTNDVAMVHNGILRDFGSKDRSDTYQFNAEILQPLLTKHPAVFNDPPFASVLEKYIGSDNKIVMMRSDGSIWTLNRSAGVTYNGVWLSNTYAWSPAGKQKYSYDRYLWDRYDPSDDLALDDLPKSKNSWLDCDCDRFNCDGVAEPYCFCECSALYHSWE